MTVAEASEAVEHAEDMLRRAATYYGEVDGFDVVSDFERAVRRCPGHFTWPQRLAVALDGARAAQKRAPISNAASWLDQQQWTGSGVEVRDAMKLLNESFEQKE